MSDIGSTDPVDQAPPPPRPVRVTVMAGDTLPIDFEPGITVGKYLERANIRPGRDQMVTLNGAPADLDDIVEENTVIVVVGKVSNG